MRSTNSLAERSATDASRRAASEFAAEKATLVADYESRLKDADFGADRLKAELSRAKEDVTRLTLKVESLEDAAKAASKKEATAERVASEQQEVVSELERRLEAKRGEANALGAAKAAIEEQAAALRAEVQTWRENFSIVVAAVLDEVDLPAELTDGLLSGEKIRFTASLHRLRESIRAYIAKRMDLCRHDEKGRADAEIGLLRTDLDASKAELAVANEKLARADSASTTAHEDSVTSVARIEQLEAEVERKAREMEETTNQYRHALEEQAAKSRESTATLLDLARAEAIKPLQVELREIRAALEDLNNEYEREIQEVITQAEGQVAAAVDGCASAQAKQSESYERQLETVRAKLEANHKEQLDAEVRRVRDEAALKETFHRKELEGLTRQLDAANREAKDAQMDASKKLEEVRIGVDEQRKICSRVRELERLDRFSN